MTLTQKGGGYFYRDRHIVDYQPYTCPDTGEVWRGPDPGYPAPDSYFTCLGGAQTFGPLCKAPYPALLARHLGLTAVNFGKGGAAPRFFLDRPALIDRANRGRFVIVQVMSARSESNALFETVGGEPQRRRADGQVMSADAAYSSLLADEALFTLRIGNRRAHIFARRPKVIDGVVNEVRRASVAGHLRLLEAIRKPVILLYISRRSPDYRAGFLTVHRLFGDFPQLVDAGMLADMAAGADHLVTSVSDRGSPQSLFDRDSGSPTTIQLSDDSPLYRGTWSANSYYPTPQMHEDAATALAPVCRALLASGQSE